MYRGPEVGREAHERRQEDGGGEVRPPVRQPGKLLC